MFFNFGDHPGTRGRYKEIRRVLVAFRKNRNTGAPLIGPRGEVISPLRRSAGAPSPPYNGCHHPSPRTMAAGRTGWTGGPNGMDRGDHRAAAVRAVDAAHPSIRMPVGKYAGGTARPRLYYYIRDFPHLWGSTLGNAFRVLAGSPIYTCAHVRLPSTHI